MLWVIAIALFGTNGIIEVCRQPTFNDIDEGKAIYQETTHIRITGNDTTSWKTYKIVWINNNK